VSHDASGIATGGTSPNLNVSTTSSSVDGRYVAYVDEALDTNTDINCVFIGTASVRLFDRQASASTVPTVVGAAFDPTTMLVFRSSLAATALNADGSIAVWEGPSASNITGDRNTNLDVFITATQGTPPPPVL